MHKGLPALRGLLAGGLLTVAAMSNGSCASEPSPPSPLNQYLLTVTPPPSGSITSADGSIDCGGKCEVTGTEGTLLALTAATSDPGYRFALWTDGCPGLTLPTCVVDFQYPTTATARFDAITCTDKLKNGGETDIDCGGTRCSGCALGQACSVDADCAAGAKCTSLICTTPVTCSVSSLSVAPLSTVTPTSVSAGSTATVSCLRLTFKFLYNGGTIIVQDFSPNDSNHDMQPITCRSDGKWYAPNGQGPFNQIQCSGQPIP